MHRQQLPFADGRGLGRALGGDRLDVRSAGVEPAHISLPVAVSVMLAAVRMVNAAQ